jgi:Tfp pilus assembly protein PilN
MGPQTQGMSFDVNLVPDDLAERSKTLSRLSLLGLVAVVSITFVGILYGALFLYQQNVSSKLHNLTQELTGMQQQIDAFKQIQLDALVLKKRTDEVATLLDRHIIWSSFFSKLEHYTLKNVTITQLNADANGKVSITAGAPSPEIAFEQLNVFLSAKDFVTDAVMPAMPTLGTTAAPSATQSSSTPTSSSIPVEFPTTAPPGTAAANSTFAIELTLIPTLFYSTTTLIDLVQ